MEIIRLLALRRYIAVFLFVCVSFFSLVGSASAFVIGPTTPGNGGLLRLALLAGQSHGALWVLVLI